MVEAPGPLTAMQSRELAELLCHRLAVFGATLLPAPGSGQIRRVSYDQNLNKRGIAADIQMGPLVLCFFAPHWLVAKIGGANLPELAALFVQRVKEVHRARRRHSDRFTRARRMLIAAIERSAAGMTLEALKTTPQRVDADLTGCQLELEASVAMLNDALQIYTQRIVGWTPRELASSVTFNGSEQRKHLRALTRVKAGGAVLEIDELAERAIVSAGASVAGCARALITSCDPQHGLGQGIVLNEDAWGATSIYLRAGRIITSLLIANVGVVSGSAFTIDRIFSAAVTEGLAGRAATAIVDRPLLHNIRIARADPHYGKQTLVRLRLKRRFIKADELDERVPLAA